MRIVTVAPAYAPSVGGAQRLLQEVSERLVQRGHDVTVLTFDSVGSSDADGSPRGALPPHEVVNGVRVIRVNPRDRALRRLFHWWLRRPGGWRSASWLLGEEPDFVMGSPSAISMLMPLLRMDVDVISSINWSWGTAYWAGVIARIRGIPHVAIPLLHLEMEWSAKSVYRRMFRSLAGAIVLTDAEGEFVRTHGAARVTVSGAAVDPRGFDQRDGKAIRSRYGIGDRPVVGFVGGQNVHKGVVTLIEAMRSVWQQMPDAVLLLAGPRSRRTEAVTSMLNALSPVERQRVVEIHDFEDDQGPSIMDAVDVLALPSIDDSFGIVLLEAWLCGKPVIGADIASTRCIVDHGVDGFLVSPRNPDDLAARILHLLANPAERERFGQHGRAKALTRYTWARVTDAWEQAYKAAVSR